jgi:divalent metal cation (Fe/Co/Zn/Cd) transporter
VSSALRAGARVSFVSLLWSTVTGTGSVALGLTGHSLVLVAFGVVALLDGAGSATLLVHFRHALRHETFSARRERIALRVVTIGLAAVGLATAVESVRRLAAPTSARALPLGVAVAGVSVAVLTRLAITKHRVARRIPSMALLADGWLSATGAALALIAVVGTAVTAVFGWRWVDPVAAIGVACGAMRASYTLGRNKNTLPAEARRA